MLTSKKKVLDLLREDKDGWCFLVTMEYTQTKIVNGVNLSPNLWEPEWEIRFLSEMKNAKRLSRIFTNYDLAVKWGENQVQELESENPADSGYVFYHIQAVPLQMQDCW